MARSTARRAGIALAIVILVGGVGLYALGRLATSPAPIPPEPPRVPDPASLRSHGSGEVVGFVGRYGSHVWLGIPYAKPPVGQRRWRAPAPPEPWTGVRESLAFGARCPQLANLFAGVADAEPGTLTGQEDCLYLNVYAPRVEADRVPRGGARLPVMVWIHGGGNVIGLSDFYDGGRLAASQDVVVVTLNYRLGPLGWFRHASLRGGDATAAERSGSFATLDLVRALEWVRDQIGAFGGDPERVTIFGESAGGRNVVTLLLSPLASGLFQRAIVQSGGLDTLAPAEAENFSDDAEPGRANSSSEVIARLLVAEGQAADRAAARDRLATLEPAALASWLRAKTPGELFAAYSTEQFEGMLDVPQSFADGVVHPTGDLVARFATADGWNRVPVMIGTTRDENRLFLFVNPLYVRRWLGLFPSLRDPDLYEATADALAAMWKATGADGPAAAMWRTQPDVYVYRFDWDEEPSLLGTDLGRALGASHAFEIPFVFGHWDLGTQGNVIFTDENGPAREELSARMMSYWAQFARTGDPGRGGRGDLVAWTAWDGRPGGHKTLLLDTEAGGGLRMGSDPVEPAGVLASVDADPRLDTQRERCWVYHELARWSLGLAERDYPSAGREGCAAYPLDGFPWE
jgi:para-nitrobenzyl esterase